MPLIQITLIEGRPPELIEQLIVDVSETVARTLETPIDRVRVAVHELPPHQWGIGGVPASRLPNRVPTVAPRLEEPVP